MYQIPGGRYESFDVGRKLRILAGENHREGSRQNSIHLLRRTNTPKRLPFQLENGRATFQHEMDVLLTNVKWQSALVLLSDIVMLLQAPEEYIRDVPKVLMASTDEDLTVSLKNFDFFTTFSQYLGHVIRPWHLRVSTFIIEAEFELKHPTNPTELRSFLAFCSVLQRFVPNIARVVALLNKKLREGQIYTFDRLSNQNITALRTLK